ncbi:Ig-like domain-containing protein [Pantoea ananatis]
MLNLADIATSQTISGVVNNVAAGSVVTLNVGNSQITATVGSNGTFTATVAPDILSTLTQGNLTIGATVTDQAGNTASTSAGIRVDTIALYPHDQSAVWRWPVKCRGCVTGPDDWRRGERCRGRFPCRSDDWRPANRDGNGRQRELCCVTDAKAVQWSRRTVR